MVRIVPNSLVRQKVGVQGEEEKEIEEKEAKQKLR